MSIKPQCKVHTQAVDTTQPIKFLDFAILSSLQKLGHTFDNNVQTSKPPVKLHIEFLCRPALSDTLIEVMTVGNRSYSHLVAFMDVK